MICFPLDNTPYQAKDMGAFLATRTRGVFSADDNLAVTPLASGLSVSVSSGLAWLKWSDYWGTAALQENSLTLSLAAADGALNRIDAVVCRLDKINNIAEIVIKKGALAVSPVIADPVRNSSYDEIYLATVFVSAGAVNLTAENITDRRLSESYCGLMRDGVTQIPTSALYAQAQALITDLQNQLVSVIDGSAYMLKTVYDTDNDGVVDNAEKLGGQMPEYYAKQTDLTSVQTTANAAMPKTGGEFTGDSFAVNTNRSTSSIRNIEVCASDGSTPVSTNSLLLVRK